MAFFRIPERARTTRPKKMGADEATGVVRSKLSTGTLSLSVKNFAVYSQDHSSPVDFGERRSLEEKKD